MTENKNIKKIIASPLVQTFLIYVSGSWIVLEMTDYFINNYNLSDRFRDILLIIMIVGLPVALFISWYLSREKEETEEKDRSLFKVLLKRPWFSIPGTLVICLLLFSAVRYIYNSDQREFNIRDQNFPNISAVLNQASEVSLAVLPFTNFTGNPDQEWLVSGQQETLINELSKISQVKPLRVISRSTVNAFKNYDKSIPELAREINVEYLVEASVMGSADSVTLQLRLIQVYPEESVIWAESTTSDFNNIINFHNNIARHIAAEIDLELSPEDQKVISSTRQVNPESYKAYLRGMYHLNQLTQESMETGLEYLLEAVRLDPAEPFAYAGLALGYLEIAHGPLDPGDALNKAEAAANQALKLDTTMAEIYAAMAETYLYKLWEFEKAEKYFTKALKLNPNLALTHYHYSWALYLWGRMDEAIIEHKLAQKYDPFNPLHTAWLGGLYFYNGQYEEAIQEANKSFEISENYPVGHLILGWVYLAQGKFEEAIEEHMKLAELVPIWQWPLGITYARTGHLQEAQEILARVEETPVMPFTVNGRTAMNAVLGNFDEAFKWLNYEPHHAWTAWTAVTPIFEELRKDPRFQAFLERLNLPD